MWENGAIDQWRQIWMSEHHKENEEENRSKNSLGEHGPIHSNRVSISNAKGSEPLLDKSTLPIQMLRRGQIASMVH